MITIKKINVIIQVELKNGTTCSPEESFIQDIRNSEKFYSLKKDNQEEVFIPHSSTSIERVVEQYEYQIEKQDVLEIVERRCEGRITEAEIKKELEGKGGKFSEEEFKNILNNLKGSLRIYNFDRTDEWVAMEFSPGEIQYKKEEEIMKDNEKTKRKEKYTGEFSCENDKP